jgi:hypothetical protein
MHGQKTIKSCQLFSCSSLTVFPKSNTRVRNIIAHNRSVFRAQSSSFFLFISRFLVPISHSLFLFWNPSVIVCFLWNLMMLQWRSVFPLSTYSQEAEAINWVTGMRRITTFRSTTDRINDGVSIIQYYNTSHCVTSAYSIQYSNMLYRFVA